MCVGENCARQASSYVKAQLSTLYKNAVDCLEHHNPHQKLTDKSRYSHALREFTYSNKRKILLQATFGEPGLEFICNHDVILRLSIESANFVLDNSAPGRDRTNMEKVSVAFRVPFHSNRLDVAELKYNNGPNPLQLVILELMKAEVVFPDEAVGAAPDTLTRYLKDYYLPFLAEAGNRVFFSIPCSDDDKYRLTIDYSTMEEKDRTELTLDDMYGISVDKINEHLSSAWLKAKLASGSTDWKTYCLAEYRCTTGSGPLFFHLHMHPPRLQPLCYQEAILCFNVDEALFYEGSDFLGRTFKGWKFAIVVDVVHGSDEHVTRCVVDFSSARFCSIHSSYGALTEGDQFAMICWARIIKFFSSTYLEDLKSIGLDVVYFFDSRWPIASGSSTVSRDEEDLDDGEEDVTTGDKNPAVALWTESIGKYTGVVFDQVFVTSQSAINKLFYFLWFGGQVSKHQDHALVRWDHLELFKARFQPLTLRLLSDGRAIIWIHIEEGTFRLPEQP